MIFASPPSLLSNPYHSTIISVATSMDQKKTIGFSICFSHKKKHIYPTLTKPSQPSHPRHPRHTQGVGRALGAQTQLFGDRFVEQGPAAGGHQLVNLGSWTVAWRGPVAGFHVVMEKHWDKIKKKYNDI